MNSPLFNSYSETMYEAAPQSITQVGIFYFSVSSTIVFWLVYAIFLGRILLRSESNPFQVVIMLSTGTPTATQGISLVSSVLSLSWGASRTFMMLRPSDKADADPELITVSLRIWPYVLEQFRSKSINIEILTLVTFVFCPID